MLFVCCGSAGGAWTAVKVEGCLYAAQLALKGGKAPKKTVADAMEAAAAAVAADVAAEAAAKTGRKRGSKAGGVGKAAAEAGTAKAGTAAQAAAGDEGEAEPARTKKRAKRS
jgi:hypothetical protein